MSDSIPYEKLKMNNGWYCIRDGDVINKADAYCPAPIGSKLFIKPGNIDKTEDENVFMIWHENVIGWLEPEDIEEEESNA